MRIARRLWTKFVVVLKVFVLLFTLPIAFGNFLLFLLIVLLFNLPILRKSVFGRLPSDPGGRNWSKLESVEYLSGLWLDIYYPESYKGCDGNRRVVLFAHGGGWITGYRRQPNNLSWYRFLLDRGFVVATIDYSMGSKAGIERLIEELSVALSYLRTRFGTRVALLGLSAGGHLALLTASRFPEFVSCVAAFYTPCDLLDIWESTSLFARFAALATLKRLPKTDRQVYRNYSPLSHVHSGFPPTLLVHGLKDRVVPFGSSVKMHKVLRSFGVSSRLLLHPSGDHGFEFVLRDSRTIEILDETVRFLKTCTLENAVQRGERSG